MTSVMVVAEVKVDEMSMRLRKLVRCVESCRCRLVTGACVTMDASTSLFSSKLGDDGGYRYEGLRNGSCLTEFLEAVD